MKWLIRVVANPAVQKATAALVAALLAVALGDAALLDGQLLAAVPVPALSALW